MLVIMSKLELYEYGHTHIVKEIRVEAQKNKMSVLYIKLWVAIKVFVNVSFIVPICLFFHDRD